MKQLRNSDDHLVVRLVDALLINALHKEASDIHLESQRGLMRVRYRIDGFLYEQEPIETGLAPQIISRLKVLARINIAQRRIPQDGKFRFSPDIKTVDVRVSTFPSLYGETMVLRLLDHTHQLLSLSNLGFSDSMRDAFEKMLARQYGLILATGPTGSGKTTTLYAALNHINTPHKHIITLEDPVEYSIDGITQGHIDPEAGFTFEKGIRAMLRQDPDILLIGEIRDRQTARIAIEAALTGHLVLSTLHTNDAPSAVIRLMDMGIEPFLISAALTGVIAQRLIRKICTNCRTEYTLTRDQEAFLTTLQCTDTKCLFIGDGCNCCNNSGYKGRTGIFELLPMSASMRALIFSNPCIDDVYVQAHRDGLVPMKYNALTKACAGTTTLQELTSVVF